MQKLFWDSLDIVKLLALLIVGAYIGLQLWQGNMDEAVKNSFLIIIGFYFGSSSGSKAKDQALLPPADKA
jgi:hypothetical protein